MTINVSDLQSFSHFRAVICKQYIPTAYGVHWQKQD